MKLYSSMIQELRKLAANELELIYKAPILVSILIAGADGKIDRKEIREAIESAEKKVSKSGSPSMSSLFSEIAQDFEDKLRVVLQLYPKDHIQRNPILVEELKQLNRLWPKINNEFSIEFYDTLLDIAKRIASSSGGVFGLKKIGSEEAKYIKLDMINQPPAT